MPAQDPIPELQLPEEEKRMASFRSGLEDVILILEELVPHCESIDGMIGMLQLALKNRSQLNMVYKLVRPVNFKS
jgi:hypothetical protein